MLDRLIGLVKIAVMVWTFFVGGLAVFSFFVVGRGGGGAVAVALVFGFLPLALMLWAGQARKAGHARTHSAMLAELGIGPGDYEHGEDGTGIAVDRKARSVTLMLAGRWKTYPYSDVRGWSTNVAKAGTIVGGNLAMATAALGANLEAERDAKARTGLFVEVRDVERAKWRIAMKDERQQARWMEILQQEINESRSAQPARA
jgi:hypothetical protein